MDISFWYYESKGDKDVPDKESVEIKYRPIFEDFYRKNTPY